MKNENSAIRNQISNFDNATYFSTKNPINKLAMNDGGLLIAAEFHFVHPVEKDILKHHKLTQNSVSFSCQSSTRFKMLHKFSTWTHPSNFDQSEHKN